MHAPEVSTLWDGTNDPEGEGREGVNKAPLIDGALLYTARSCVTSEILTKIR